MELKVYKTDGTLSEETVTLPDEIFGIEPHTHLIYQAVRTYLSNKRQGTHKTKEKGEVKGSGRKPFRQKGTGRARQGSVRSPLNRGGGNVFGPKPHKYYLSINKKAAKLARKSALSLKARENEIIIVQDFRIKTPKTKDLYNVLKALKLDDKKTLMLLPEKDESLYKSGRNIPNLKIMISDKAATYDILNNKMLLIQKSAIEPLCKPLM